MTTAIEHLVCDMPGTAPDELMGTARMQIPQLTLELVIREHQQQLHYL